MDQKHQFGVVSADHGERIEIIGPDPKVVEILEKIIGQNLFILSMNEAIISKLLSPPLHFRSESRET